MAAVAVEVAEAVEAAAVAEDIAVEAVAVRTNF